MLWEERIGELIVRRQLLTPRSRMSVRVNIANSIATSIVDNKLSCANRRAEAFLWRIVLQWTGIWDVVSVAHHYIFQVELRQLSFESVFYLAEKVSVKMNLPGGMQHLQLLGQITSPDCGGRGNKWKLLKKFGTKLSVNMTWAGHGDVLRKQLGKRSKEASRIRAFPIPFTTMIALIGCMWRIKFAH